MYYGVLEAISQRIRESFGSEVKVLIDGPETGLQAPCFCVNLVKASETQRMGVRHRQEMEVLIRHAPANKEEGSRQLYTIAENLWRDTETISLSDESQVRGIRPEFQIKDGELYFTIHYHMFVIRQEITSEEMESLSAKPGIRPQT